MKMLVATKQTNDPACGDFFFAAEGELVYKADSCQSPKHPDCPRCSRALAGARTQCFTNTVMVADAPLFLDELDGMHESFRALHDEAEKYELGSVLEVIEGGEFFLRQGEHVWPDTILDD